MTDKEIKDKIAKHRAEIRRLKEMLLAQRGETKKKEAK